MHPHRPIAATLALSALAVGACLLGGRSSSAPVIGGHPVRLDETRKLLPWTAAPVATERRRLRWPHGFAAAARPDDAAYARVARLAWTALETKFSVEDNGLPTWLAYSRFDPQTFEGVAWPHNPASLYAMLTESAALWYAFSGDEAAIELARRGLDYQIAHGSTPEGWSWARVPYASAAAGDIEYQGADDAWCDYCGRGDGIGVVEPDKVAELGLAYARMFELTREPRYASAAIACADALASHVRPGDERHSPWPFRVYAFDDVAREEYSSNVVAALSLFEELGRLALGDVEAYARAGAVAFAWLMGVPLRNDAWSGYFEDIAIKPDPNANPNQYVALQTARWLLAHPKDDPSWRQHAGHLLAWTARVFGGDTPTERGEQWGATVMSEQADDMAKMGSHTARFGATLALWAEATGDERALDGAARSLNWATYMCREDGLVAVGEDTREGYWFSDGYADYVRHFLVAMGAAPEWAPASESHIVRSTSVVTHVAYEPARIAWTTFDADAVETLRLADAPLALTVDGDRIEGDELAPVRANEAASSEGARIAMRPLASGGMVLRVHHRTGAPVVVALPAGAPRGGRR